MDRLDAVTFGRLLHGLLPMSQERLDRAVDLSARALARCHTVFRLPDCTPLKADESAREGDINRCLLETEGLASASGLNIRVKPFFDFSIWNIMLGESKAYLIDFPNGSYVSSPHLDLGGSSSAWRWPSSILPPSSSGLIGGILSHYGRGFSPDIVLR
jgi:hypothetical protein